MKMGGIIAIGAFACLIGAFMPGRQEPRDAAREGSGAGALAASQGSDAESRSADYLIGEMVLQQQADGHFYASPRVNMVAIDALVDTGASVIALTGSDAEAIGLSWDPNAVRVIGQGASGDVMGVPVRLERVELGTFEVRDVDAVIIPEGLHVTLLGQSFLSRIPSVEIADGQMSLSDR